MGVMEKTSAVIMKELVGTKEVFITKAQYGWSVKEIFHWEGFPSNEGNKGEHSLAWAVFNAADAAARQEMTITSVEIKGVKASRQQLIKLISKIASGMLEYARMPSTASLGEEVI